MSGLGIYSKSWDIVWLGLIFVGVSVIAGFVLHFFFGIKIIDLTDEEKQKFVSSLDAKAKQILAELAGGAKSPRPPDTDPEPLR